MICTVFLPSDRQSKFFCQKLIKISRGDKSQTWWHGNRKGHASWFRVALRKSWWWKLMALKVPAERRQTDKCISSDRKFRLTTFDFMKNTRVFWRIRDSITEINWLFKSNWLIYGTCFVRICESLHFEFRHFIQSTERKLYCLSDSLL